MRSPKSPARLPKPSIRPGRTLEVELITQLFGGGAEARVIDPSAWLRPSAVRGSLRFWWRALHAHEHEHIASLRAAEDVLFGSAATSGRAGAGRISTAVRTTNAVEVGSDYSSEQGDALNVAYFAAAPMGQVAARLGGGNATATLTVSAPTEGEVKQVLRPLVCWLLFGGAGARTRRGAGAVAPGVGATEIGYPATKLELSAFLRALPVATPEPRIPIFSVADREGVWLGKEQRSAEAAHRALLTMWRDVRQWRRHPSNWKGGRDWGMSQWPEPDLIRTQARQHSQHHEPRAGKTAALRPHLGLPMGMKFKDRADPPPVELLPTQGERYASPVWLGVSRVGGQFVPIALVTRSRLQGPIRIAGNDRKTLPLGPTDHAYQRLTEQLKHHGFEKVTP